jgi:hypothetical protein
MPDVTHLAEDNARVRLLSFGFDVDAVDQPTTDPTEADRVIAQSLGGKCAKRLDGHDHRRPSELMAGRQYAVRTRVNAGNVSMISRTSSRNDQFVTYR